MAQHRAETAASGMASSERRGQQQKPTQYSRLRNTNMSRNNHFLQTRTKTGARRPVGMVTDQIFRRHIQIVKHQGARRQITPARVASPLPVRTRMGRPPTAATACRSRRLSPTSGRLSGAGRARRCPAPCPAAACGRRSRLRACAGRKTPRRCAHRHLMRQMVHFFVHGVQRVHIEQAPAQAGLIGGHHHASRPASAWRWRPGQRGSGTHSMLF